MTHETFEQAARAYADMIYRVALHALGSRADAEDVMQTVLLKLFEYAGGFESEEHLKHWLLRVAVNESRRLLRAPWRQRSVPLEEWRETPAPQREEEREVLRAVMALPAKYRLAVYLYYYEGCSVSEAARAMHAKESTVQTWLQRARGRLRAALENDEEGTDYAVRPKMLL